MSEELIKKYNVPAPRYTSYPTVPFWDKERLTYREWIDKIRTGVGENGHEVSIYIHLPFCESLCTFCGCNKRITRNHAVEEPYIEAILKEWEIYLRHLPFKPTITDLHLGGGTPTFFSPGNLQRLIEGITKNSNLHSKASFSFEGNPVNTTRDQLETLYRLGFRRASYGIQDFDPQVQYIINREQSYELVKEVTEMTRQVGFNSINYDLVYGLPFQTLDSIDDTFEKTGELMPERIAFYSYAHVPWIKGVGQRRFSEEDLPKDHEKRRLYERGRYYLETLEYAEIGMDHFALSSDDLYRAAREGSLHRNFMGYTEVNNKNLIGLGVSAICDIWSGFAQNVKVIEDYYSRLEKEEIPVFRGHFLTNEDLTIREHILNIMCSGTTTWGPEKEFSDIYERLIPLKEDNIIELTESSLKVTNLGQTFLRNICMAFDRRLWRNKPETQLFSMSI